MFSALSQGSLIYVLDKTSRPSFKVGQVTAVTKPENTNFNYLQGTFNQSPIDIKVVIDGKEQPFSGIPSNLSYVTYNGGKVVLSETKQGIQQEVEAILQNSKQIVENLDTYKQNIIDCENILKELNPQFAKDKERDERLDSLEERFGGVENKIDKLLTLIEK